MEIISGAGLICLSGEGWLDFVHALHAPPHPHPHPPPSKPATEKPHNGQSSRLPTAVHVLPPPPLPSDVFLKKKRKGEKKRLKASPSVCQLASCM